MKKVFLRITPSEKPNKDLKILNLCYWPINFRKDNYTLNYKNFFKSQNNKNRIKNFKLAHKISIKIIKFLYKKLSKESNLKFSKEEYELIFYQFINAFTYMVIDRKFMIDEFFLNKKIKKLIANEIYQTKDEFICNSSIEFLNLIQKDEFNNFLVLEILKENENFNIEIKKNNVRKNIKKSVNKNFFSKLNDLIQTYLSKFSFNFNKIVFESIYYPRLKFLKDCLRFRIFPYKVSKLFFLNFNSELDVKKRKKLKNYLNLTKFSKFEKLVGNLLFDIIPKNYLENFDQIISHLHYYSNKKKIITSISFYYNEIFRMFLVFAKRNKTKIIQCDHGGGLSFKNVPMPYIQKKIFDNFAVWGKHAHGKGLPYKKKIFINPTLPSLDINLSKSNKNYLSILFYESRKFIIEYDALQSFENQNKSLNDLILISKKLPKKISKKIVFRSLRNYGLESQNRFYENFLNSKKNRKNFEISKSFEKILKHSKLIVCNFPSTSFSEALSFNIPTLLFCNEKEILLDKRSRNFLIKMKKNKMSFDDTTKLKEHIKNIWANPNGWWEKKNIQNLRIDYLRSYFNVIDHLPSSWIKD